MRANATPRLSDHFPWAVLATALLLLGACAGGSGEPPRPEPPALDSLQPFAEFVAALAETTSADLGAGAVASGAELERMRSHLQELYRGIEVSHSFLHGESHPVDCVPIAQQPALRRPGVEGQQIASPPEFPAHPSGDDSEAPVGETVESNLEPGEDRFGNSRSCPADSFPMRRITLAEVSRFATLEDFFSKSPGGGGHPDLDLAAQSSTHYYAHARQSVANRGGTSWLNLWSPTVASGRMSLSQQWTVAGSGSSLQTVEGGWQVYPQKYGTSLAVPFIYWTSAAYSPGTGCYNLDCPGFVQISGSWILGAPFASNWYSVMGGAQGGYTQQWYYYLGNWWLAYNSYAVGYYPGSLYGSGPLASGSATKIDFGGEDTGAPSALQMGSGQFANAGYSYAAYQSAILYYNSNGAATNTVLSASQTDPSCYTINLYNTTPTYFYFGGPSCN